MKKFLLMLMLIFLVVSCAKKSSSSSNKSSVDTPAISVDPEDILLSASRDYRPSDWNNDERKLEFAASFLIPEEVDLIAGNSATGWMSLYVGSRKFCYQGNGANNSSIGDKFILKHEKLSLEEQCHNSTDNIEFSAIADVELGDEVKLVINGGGCSSICEYTEVEVLLELDQEISEE